MCFILYSCLFIHNLTARKETDTEKMLKEEEKILERVARETGKFMSRPNICFICFSYYIAVVI